MSLLLEAFPSGPIVLDSSAIFNLLGCHRAVEIVHALGVSCLVEEHTLSEIKRHPIPGLDHKIFFTELTDSGLVKIYRMSDEEYDIYLNLVAGTPTECLGDGESAAIAVAVVRKLAVILDDGKARRVCANRFSSAIFSSSLRLILAAGEKANWTTDEILSVIQTAQLNSRMNIVKDDRVLFSSLKRIT